ncbi:DUF6098 family protein [Mumia sp. DW29H23]|uniref:DUF6098 family protein n=1 Tax=Mumia sp. DW29H23 TaxID=3421241 RepID=UPI003D699EEA
MDEIDDFDRVVTLVEENPGLYLRYSQGPEHDLDEGPSRDYESGQDMPGWSVTTVDPEPWWDRAPADWIARRLCKYAELGEEGRFPWLLRGRRVGTGPDHEPLVNEMSAVAAIGKSAVDEARERYEATFDVGNDSRDET